tara:strand:+ start:4365 stop:4601 length:237 start_codon:yes stop_codon:yes gene_type:complete
MKRDGGDSLKREIFLALMIVIIFISLVVTWTVVEAIDEYMSNTETQQGSPITGSVVDDGARVGITILPPNSLDSGGGA